VGNRKANAANTGRHACGVEDNAMRTFVQRGIGFSRSGQLYLSKSGQLLVSAEAVKAVLPSNVGDAQHA
jgi:hypothetical protein